MNVQLPDGSIIEDVPDGTSKVDLLGKLQRAGHPAAPLLLKQMASEQTLGDMGGLDKFNAGMGLAFTNLGRGAKQVLGMGGGDFQENKGIDKALTSTGAGMAGNIAGNVAMLAPAAVIPGANTIAGAGTIGAITAALQPTDTTGERFKNMAIGGSLGSGVQAVGQYPTQIYEGAKTLAKKPFQIAQAAVEPLYEGGREKILSRALAEATGSGRQDAIRNLKNAAEIVPGSLPTAAETANSGGIAAMQRAAAAADPEAYTARAAQQNEARVKELFDLSGTQGARASIESNRDQVANGLYRKAREQGIDQQMAAAMKPQLDNLMERMPSGVLDKAKELARLNGEVMGKDGSLNGLHWIKLATDDLLSSAAQNGIGKQSERAITQFKGDLLSVMDELSPAYGAARSTYQTMSRPVNQMNVAQAVSDRAINPLTGNIQPLQYARALSDDTAASATGFNKAKLENTLEPNQLARLNAIKDDLARSVEGRDLGRGTGSDTVQKLSMTNLMQRSGLPLGVLHTPGVSRVGNWLYQNADQEMKAKLAEALLDPKKTAALMEKVKPYIPMGDISQLTKEKAALLGRALTLPVAQEASQ